MHSDFMTVFVKFYFCGPNYFTTVITCCVAHFGVLKFLVQVLTRVYNFTHLPTGSLCG